MESIDRDDYKKKFEYEEKNEDYYLNFPNSDLVLGPILYQYLKGMFFRE